MSVRVLLGDCLDILPTLAAGSVQCCVTSPPYFGLRDYGAEGQIGLEAAPAAYIATIVAVFREVRRVLRDDGTLWLNLGDSYAGSRAGPQGKLGEMADRSIASQREMRREDGKHKARLGAKAKDLLGIPWRVAFALQDDGWFLRSDIIWVKPNPMPESVADRPTSAHEHVFLLTKQARYFYDAEAIREAGTSERDRGRPDGSATFERFGVNTSCGTAVDGTRNARNVWIIATQPFAGAHFATMPPELAERCIKAGSGPGDTVLDPFAGAFTTALVADRLHRDAIGIELNPAYCAMAQARIERDAGMFAQVAAE